MTKPATCKSVVITAALLAIFNFASAETVLLAPSKDNTLIEEETSNSNGKGSYIFAGATEDNFIRRALIAFDLSSIPTNATITAATLTLFSSKSRDNTPFNVSLRKVSQDWGEGASNAPGEEGKGTQAQTGDATWSHRFFSSSMWNSAGGDFSGTASATTAVGATNRSYSWSSNGMVADVQGWVSNPATNFGWAIIGAENVEGSAERFNSRENTSNPPQLSVTYTTPTPTPTPAQLLNISTRMRVETGNNVLIGGFLVTGNASKKVILRAIGPSLTERGVADALQNPILQLFGPNNTLLFENDNWRSHQEAAIQETGVPPDDDLESAIVATLPPASYTAIVRGVQNGTGVGLVEAFDLNSGADSRLANISTRGLVLTGGNVMIGGFIAGGGTGETKVLLRAIGPSLSDDGVSNPLPDPTLRFVTGNGMVVAENDDWQDDPDQAEQIAATGVPPEHPAESALIATIPPGDYTATVAGKNGATGVALVEVFNIR